MPNLNVTSKYSMHPFYTIGHSTRSITEFVDLLGSVEVTMVVDVRTVPRSRTNPQYNRDSLPDALGHFKVGCEHIASLGGLRRATRNVSFSVNAFWQNKSFHNYPDYAMGKSFHEGGRNAAPSCAPKRFGGGAIDE
jgi:uncharacterized protein (DUF488 family)